MRQFQSMGLAAKCIESIKRQKKFKSTSKVLRGKKFNLNCNKDCNMSTELKYTNSR